MHLLCLLRSRRWEEVLVLTIYCKEATRAKLPRQAEPHLLTFMFCLHDFSVHTGNAFPPPLSSAVQAFTLSHHSLDDSHFSLCLSCLCVGVCLGQDAVHELSAISQHTWCPHSNQILQYEYPRPHLPGKELGKPFLVSQDPGIFFIFHIFLFTSQDKNTSAHLQSLHSSPTPFGQFCTLPNSVWYSPSNCPPSPISSVQQNLNKSDSSASTTVSSTKYWIFCFNLQVVLNMQEFVQNCLRTDVKVCHKKLKASVTDSGHIQRMCHSAIF